MNNAGVETLSSDLYLANKKRGGAFAAPPAEQKRPGWGKAAKAPSHLLYRILSDVIFPRYPLHVCSKFHNFEIRRVSRRAVRRFGNEGAKSLVGPQLEPDSQML